VQLRHFPTPAHITDDHERRAPTYALHQSGGLGSLGVLMAATRNMLCSIALVTSLTGSVAKRRAPYCGRLEATFPPNDRAPTATFLPPIHYLPHTFHTSSLTAKHSHTHEYHVYHFDTYTHPSNQFIHHHIVHHVRDTGSEVPERRR
jgi:hypothetical protein